VRPGEIEVNLQVLLNQWDPIGVADVVEDEYDCLIWPLLSRLTAGAGRAEISEFLSHELADHFGLHPEHCGVEPMTDRLVSWWVTANSA
jgi:hypothetical protein